MSEEKKENPGKSNAGGAASTAENYIDEELIKARKGLKTARIVMGVLVAIVLTYMSFITVQLGKFTDPEQAAELAVVYARPHLDTQVAALMEQLDTQIPKMLEGLPDQVLDSLPRYRADIQARITAAMTEQATKTSDEMGEQLDTFLEAHGDSVAELLRSSDDPDVVREFAVEITSEITRVLDEPGPGHESIREKLNLSLAALRGIEDHVARLAQGGKSLTEQEQKQRRVIGILIRTIDNELHNATKVYSTKKKK